MLDFLKSHGGGHGVGAYVVDVFFSNASLLGLGAVSVSAKEISWVFLIFTRFVDRVIVVRHY